jgi:hypothetical protein
MIEESLLAKRLALLQARHRPEQKVTIEGTSAQVVSPEGTTGSIELVDLIRCLDRQGMSTGRVVLPDGVKAVLSSGSLTIWVHQTPPRVHNLKWIAADSPVPFGKGAKYRSVRIALPYLIVLAVFAPREQPQVISDANECFFRTDPLTSLDDPLLYPALLNCSKFAMAEGHPLAWICTQHLNRRALLQEKDENRRMHKGLGLILQCLLGTGFNHSSEFHEGTSWYTESSSVDPRIATIEAWEEATRQNSLFAQEVPWLPTGLTAMEVIQRIFRNHHVDQPAIRTAGDLARIICNHQRPSGGEPATGEEKGFNL